MAAATAAETELLAELLARASEPVAELAELAELAAGDDELAVLVGLLDRAFGDPHAAAATAAGVPACDDAAYERHKSRAAEREAAKSRAGRDIGELPAVVDPERREACRLDLKLFFETYHAETFCLAWSRDHLRIIPKLEAAILRGGLRAVAMPRGSGKSSMCEAAAQWAVLYGHRRYVVLIGADEGHAAEILESIKFDLESLELLAADFPEVIYPVRCLEGLANRCRGQLYRGERTRIGWGSRQIVLPTIPGSVASMSIIRTAGITGRIRGMKFSVPGGGAIRPDFVLPDDPQTRESARSADGNRVRLATLNGDILGLAGPGQRIAGLMPFTIIEPGDAMWQIAQPDQYTEWLADVTRMVDAFPKNMRLWEQYAEIRAQGLALGDDGAAGNAFYAEHRAAMDAGADIPWPERVLPGDLSALQSAMNLLFRDADAFWAEYQNEPRGTSGVDPTDLVPAKEIAVRVTGLPRRVVPDDAVKLTAFVDIQQELLYFAVVAWANGFTGRVLDYGAWPDQCRQWWRLSDANPTLQDRAPGATLEGAIYRGLDELAAELLGRDWLLADGRGRRVDRLLIDANWGESTGTVYQWCRETDFAALVLPAHGRFFGAASVPMNDLKVRPGDLVGWNWRVPADGGRRGGRGRHVTFDANAWKSFLQQRLRAAVGDAGSLALFDGSPAVHRMISEHLTAEYRVRTSGRGRELDEWKLQPSRPDNHLLDCVAGCCVAASMEGLRMVGHDAGGGRRRKARRRLSDIQREKKGRQ